MAESILAESIWAESSLVESSLEESSLAVSRSMYSSCDEFSEGASLKLLGRRFWEVKFGFDACAAQPSGGGSQTPKPNFTSQ